MGLVKIYSYNTATALNWGDFDTYPIHVVLLNFTVAFRLHTLNSSHTLVRYLLVGFWDVLRYIKSAWLSEIWESLAVRKDPEV